ncbi:hypothetical protein [Haloarchaeobius sp. HRN-SO-5]|uniref:DUF5789 family protein n=1 Tax=Haloarchaeobius sp. HRN-SO-5 TaxID=3446118 RepID=UPI003EB6D37E
MPREVEYVHVDDELEDLNYPVLRVDAAVDLADTTLVLPDGEVNLGALISETDSDAFHSPGDLLAELDELVPTAGNPAGGRDP